MPVSSVKSKEDLLGVDEPTRFPPDYARMTPHREVEGSGEETLEEEGVGGEPVEEGEVGGEAGGGEVDPALWGDLPPGAPQGWLRGNAGLPTPPSIEEHKWLIEPVGTE